jgi:hypothetical protein
MCTRLSRNLAFIAALMDSGVEFIAVDNPHANKLTIHILAAVAQHEREAISERTKAALAAAKARGVKLGKPRLAEARADVIEARIAAADAFAANHRANPEQRRHEPPWTRQGLSARGRLGVGNGPIKSEYQPQNRDVCASAGSCRVLTTRRSSAAGGSAPMA